MRALASVALAVALLIAAPGAHAASTQRVGAVTLHRCAFAGGWCGSIERRLDPSNPHGPRVGVRFRWLPASGGHARGATLVAVEGGPGFPSIGSRSEYQGMYGPLLRTRDLLLVDNRGTGRSGVIDCPDLQGFAGVTSTPGFPTRVAACAKRINRGYRHATDFYGTAYAVDDLSAVMRKLRLGRVDLYGDSYGTWFAQSFMARHPGQLHSVVLDSAYPVRGLDPWYASSGPAARDAMDAVCERDLACAGLAGGSATARLGQLVAQLRQRPIEGNTRDADSSSTHVTVDVRALVNLVQDAGSDPIVYRELDASVRAALAGDPGPLLRLTAQSQSWSNGTSSASYFSVGLYFGVTCVDYPQLFDLRASPSTRRDQLGAALGMAPDAFEPFTPGEWIQMSAYSEAYEACLDWPRPGRHLRPLPSRASPLPASVPILVIGGDLDSLTPLADAQKLAPSLGRKVRVVNLRNTVHVTTEGDTMLFGGATCGRRIVRAFLRAPQSLARLDARCADSIPPVHTPGSYPRMLADAPAAVVLTGPDPGDRAKRAVTVAAGALADASIRFFYVNGENDRGPGLRGGAFTVKPGKPGVADFSLHGVRFVSDARVDGNGTWRTGGDGRFHGELVVKPVGEAPVHLTVDWNQRASTALATVGGATVTLPAP
jgi:pimeloyl-ACP methyl ester carboxylesterase